MKPLEVCKSCGLPFEKEDMENGFCPNCPAITENVLDAPVIALRNISELDAE